MSGRRRGQAGSPWRCLPLWLLAWVWPRSSSDTLLKRSLFCVYICIKPKTAEEELLAQEDGEPQRTAELSSFSLAERDEYRGTAPHSPPHLVARRLETLPNGLFPRLPLPEEQPSPHTRAFPQATSAFQAWSTPSEGVTPPAGYTVSQARAPLSLRRQLTEEDRTALPRSTALRRPGVGPRPQDRICHAMRVKVSRALRDTRRPTRFRQSAAAAVFRRSQTLPSVNEESQGRPPLWPGHIKPAIHVLQARAEMENRVPNLGRDRDGICRSWGQHHYETFDGIYFYFPGTCSYILAQDCHSAVPQYTVWVHNSRVCEGSVYSCPRALSLFFPNEEEIHISGYQRASPEILCKVCHEERQAAI
ncbi:unnamed protein product [Gadus morhua 'NCC']